MCTYIDMEAPDYHALADGTPVEFDNLLEGHCAICKGELVKHSHEAKWLASTYHPTFPLPSELQFAACPNGCGCWRREGNQVWALLQACCGGALLEAKGFAIFDARLEPDPKRYVRMLAGGEV